MDNKDNLDVKLNDIFGFSFVKLLKIFFIILSIFILVRVVYGIKEYDLLYESAKEITVRGVGKVSSVPNIANISFIVKDIKPSASEAEASVSGTMKKIISGLKEKGIDEKDIKTDYYNLSPEYEQEQILCVAYPCVQPKTKITGYSITQNVTVRIRKIDTTSSVLGLITENKASNISGPNFTTEDMDILLDEARLMAIADAKIRAIEIAKKLGVKLGSARFFSDNNGGGYYTRETVMDAKEGSLSGVPKLPVGENVIVSNVSITYEIR